MATFGPGKLRYMAKNLKHESAQFDVDQGVSSKLPATVAAPLEGQALGHEEAPGQQALKLANSSQPGNHDSALYRHLKDENYVDDLMLQLYADPIPPTDLDDVQAAVFSGYEKASRDILEFYTVEVPRQFRTSRYVVFKDDPLDLYDLIARWNKQAGNSAAVLCQQGMRFRWARIKEWEGADVRWGMASRVEKQRPAWAPQKTSRRCRKGKTLRAKKIFEHEDWQWDEDDL